MLKIGAFFPEICLRDADLAGVSVACLDGDIGTACAAISIGCHGDGDVAFVLASGR